LTVVVAVKHFNIDARISHPSRELTELTRNFLFEPLHNNITNCEHFDPGAF